MNTEYIICSAVYIISIWSRGITRGQCSIRSVRAVSGCPAAPLPIEVTRTRYRMSSRSPTSPSASTLQLNYAFMRLYLLAFVADRRQRAAPPYIFDCVSLDVISQLKCYSICKPVDNIVRATFVHKLSLHFHVNDMSLLFTFN